jgi:two-component system, chemotaxis family, chemotaxis protein CheY
MKKILIVDDSATIREQVKAAFASKADYQIVEAENGVDALAKLAANTDVRLLISDINMPEMDGITLIKHVSENASYKAIPIVMLTTEVSADLKTQAKNYGVKAWIVKPFTPEKIVMAADQLTK